MARRREEVVAIVGGGTVLQLRRKQERRWRPNDIGGVLAEAYVGGDCEGSGEDGKEEGGCGFYDGWG